MYQAIGLLAAGLALAGCAAGRTDHATAPDQSMARVHIGHVMSSWQDTPDNRGLLPTAAAEAEIAAQHAGFAASRPDDLEWMQLHVGHVVNAVDPAIEPQGPGLGYGVERAATGVAQHVRFAAASPDASDNVKLHAQHVAASADDVVGWSRQIVALGAEVEAAASADQAAPLVAEIQSLTDAIRNGVDADGDGQVSWQSGEGGLAQAQQHMGFMTEGEGLS